MAFNFFRSNNVKSSSRRPEGDIALTNRKENLTNYISRFSVFVPNMRRYLPNKKIVIFGITAGVGLALDMIIFYFLTSQKINIIFSNIVSSFLGVTFVYLTSVKIVFTNRNYSYKRYVVFVVYYGISIFCFSCLIAFIATNYIEKPLLAKATVVPISFFVNYFFSSKII